MVIYRMDSVIRLSNNWGQKSMALGHSVLTRCNPVENSMIFLANALHFFVYLSFCMESEYGKFNIMIIEKMTVFKPLL